MCSVSVEGKGKGSLGTGTGSTVMWSSHMGIAPLDLLPLDAFMCSPEPAIGSGFPRSCCWGCLRSGDYSGREDDEGLGPPWRIGPSVLKRGPATNCSSHCSGSLLMQGQRAACPQYGVPLLLGASALQLAFRL